MTSVMVMKIKAAVKASDRRQKEEISRQDTRANLAKVEAEVRRAEELKLLQDLLGCNSVPERLKEEVLKEWKDYLEGNRKRLGAEEVDPSWRSLSYAQHDFLRKKHFRYITKAGVDLPTGYKVAPKRKNPAKPDIAAFLLSGEVGEQARASLPKKPPGFR